MKHPDQAYIQKTAYNLVGLVQDAMSDESAAGYLAEAFNQMFSEGVNTQKKVEGLSRDGTATIRGTLEELESWLDPLVADLRADIDGCDFLQIALDAEQCQNQCAAGISLIDMHVNTN